MASAETLTIAFLGAHPAQAARVLEKLPGPEAAALFTRVPARVGAPVLAAMLPPTAARIFGRLDDQTALPLLAAIGAQAAVAVLRHVGEPRHSTLIEGLPTSVAIASRLLLGSLEDSVGGWADPDVIALAPGITASEAQARVRRGEEMEAEQLYVVDTEHRLLGCVDLHALMRAPDSTPVSALMREAHGALAANAPLASAGEDAAWERAVVLPVIDRGERLLGVLRRSTLRRALAQMERSEPEAGEPTVVGMLAQGFWDTVSGLAEAGLVLLPCIKPVLPEKR